MIRNLVLILILVYITLKLYCKSNDHNQICKLIAPFTTTLFTEDHRHSITEFSITPNGPILLFIGTPEGETNKVLVKGTNQDLAESLGLDLKVSTYGSVAIDLDKDGYVDLMLGTSDGVYICKNNYGFMERPFTLRKIMDKNLNKTPYHLTIYDFNRDGNPDVYVKQFNDNNGSEEKAVILRHIGSYEFKLVSEGVNNNLLDLKNESDNLSDGGNFIQINLPKNIDYAGARVTVIIGKIAYTKYHKIGTNQDRLLTFNLGNHKFIDKLKIRTIYSKDFNYLEPKINDIMHIRPQITFEQTHNKWRSTSSAS